jgi:hypothetical protein
MKPLAKPVDAVRLLEEARVVHGLPDPAAAAVKTDRAGQTKALARAVVLRKHGKGPSEGSGRQ